MESPRYSYLPLSLIYKTYDLQHIIHAELNYTLSYWQLIQSLAWSLFTTLKSSQTRVSKYKHKQMNTYRMH